MRGICQGLTWWLLLCAGVRAQAVFVNEIHYDNAGTDTGEGVEIAGTAGTPLDAFDLVFYNGNGGMPYRTVSLSGAIPDENGSGAGAVWFAVEGIQNGDPDGVALVERATGAVLHSIAWDGEFTGAGGVAAGMAFPDIGPRETGSTPPGMSLQLIGTARDPSGFEWSGPAPASPGLINAGQVLVPEGGRLAVMAIAPGIVREGESTAAMLAISPPPESPQTFLVTSNPPGLLVHPPEVTAAAGQEILTIPIGAATDGEPDGFREAVVFVEGAAGDWPPAAAGVQIIDADRPPRMPGLVRLVSLNVRLGAGAPGSAEFAALREEIERLSPDILLLQEVHDANGFADVRTLLRQAGFPEGGEFVAVEGEAFDGEVYSGGDFNVAQSVVTASRWPIVRRVQIGRGIPDRREITRFPLFAAIDVPGVPAERDPAVVNVHLKASDTEADCFRRAVEALRIREFLTAEGYGGGEATAIVAGDFNASDFMAQPVEFSTAIDPATHRFADGSGFPDGFRLGDDLTAGGGRTLAYSVFPHSAFAAAGLAAVDARQADGSVYTFAFAPYRLDYVFLPAAMADGGRAFAEVWNSRLDAADGLPKRADPADPGLSEAASDHFAVVVDFPLVAQPALSLTLSPSSLDERDGGSAVAVVAIDPPPSAPVDVRIGPWRGGPPETDGGEWRTLTPANPSAEVTLTPWHDPLPGRHRLATILATADEYAPALATLEVRNVEALGLLVISQYSEPAAGSSPRALEICNASGATIDFAQWPVEIRRYADGSREFSVEARIGSGVLPAGGVVVVGDPGTGNYLVSRGVLPQPGAPFAAAAENTGFAGIDGNVAYVKATTLRDANDALELVAGGFRCDVFGTIGLNPGSAWTGSSGISTAGANLELRPQIFTGSAGFADPGTRFAVAEGSALTGFGIPPAIADPYLAWAEARGLTGLDRAPNADPAGTGLPNLLRWIFDGGSPPAVFGGGGTMVARSADPWLAIGVERSDAMDNWLPDPQASAVPRADGFTEWSWPAGGPREFRRVTARRP